MRHNLGCFLFFPRLFFYITIIIIIIVICFFLTCFFGHSCFLFLTFSGSLTGVGPDLQTSCSYQTTLLRSFFFLLLGFFFALRGNVFLVMGGFFFLVTIHRGIRNYLFWFFFSPPSLESDVNKAGGFHKRPAAIPTFPIPHQMEMSAGEKPSLFGPSCSDPAGFRNIPAGERGGNRRRAVS